MPINIAKEFKIGWGERNNPNSWWNKKRNPKIQAETPQEVKIIRRETFWHRLINEIKYLIKLFKGGK